MEQRGRQGGPDGGGRGGRRGRGMKVQWPIKMQNKQIKTMGLLWRYDRRDGRSGSGVALVVRRELKGAAGGFDQLGW